MVPSQIEARHSQVGGRHDQHELTSRGVWTYKTREGVATFLFGWLKALRWQRLREMEKLADTLVKHFDGIAAYCEHPVRFGVVESLTILDLNRRSTDHRSS